MMEMLGVADWTTWDAENPAPTFFARPPWTIALCDASENLEPFPMRIRAGANAFVVPAVRSRARLGMRDVVAFPMGGYTCVLDERGKPADAVTSSHVFHIISRNADRVQVIPWPLGPQPVLPSARIRRYETAVIDCGGGYEAAVSGIRGVTRRMAGQAERRGVVIRRADDLGPATIGAYYSILEEASVGWGLARPPISRPLLEAVASRGRDAVEIWFAEVESVKIAGGVVLYGSDELFFWSAAMRREYAQYRPSNLLNLRLIQAACERGVRWYNLGASEGLAGVERFKHDLGARSVTYGSFTLRSTKFHLYERIRSALQPKEVG